MSTPSRCSRCGSALPASATDPHLPGQLLLDVAPESAEQRYIILQAASNSLTVLISIDSEHGSRWALAGSTTGTRYSREEAERIRESIIQSREMRGGTHLLHPIIHPV